MRNIYHCQHRDGKIPPKRSWIRIKNWINTEIQSFIPWSMFHLSTEFCENRLSRIGVILLTNERTNLPGYIDENITSLAEVKKTEVYKAKNQVPLTGPLLTKGRSLSKSRSRSRTCCCRPSSDDLTATDCLSCWLQRLHSHISFRHRSTHHHHHHHYPPRQLALSLKRSTVTTTMP